MSYDNTNSGMLARNDKKETEKHPDFKGSINVDGVDYWLSAWVREGKEGARWQVGSSSPYPLARRNKLRRRKRPSRLTS
jgi:hypothetical protein